MNAKLIVFDFNGTLLFDYIENKEAWNQTSLHFTDKPIDDRKYESFVGMTDTECAKMIENGASYERAEEIFTYKENIYKELCYKRKIELAPYAKDFIEMAKKSHIEVAICSSCPKINMAWYIPYFSLDRLFKENLVYGMEMMRSKPYPDVYTYTLNKIGVRGDEAICFEDGENGLRAAIAAGFNRVYAIKSPGIDLSITGRLAPLISWKEALESFNEVIRLN